jgi:hypothetical protein
MVKGEVGVQSQINEPICLLCFQGLTFLPIYLPIYAHFRTTYLFMYPLTYTLPIYLLTHLFTYIYLLGVTTKFTQILTKF